MPKLRRIFSLVSRPFWWPTTATGRPRNVREAGDDGGVVGERPVAVQLDEVRHERLRRSRGCTGRAGWRATSVFCQGVRLGVDLPGDPVELLPELLDLRAGGRRRRAARPSSSIRRRSRRIGSSKSPFSEFTCRIVPAGAERPAGRLQQILRIHVHRDLDAGRGPFGDRAPRAPRGRSAVGRAQQDLEPPAALEPLERRRSGARDPRGPRRLRAQSPSARARRPRRAPGAGEDTRIAAISQKGG